jgi:hypothetical protein
MPDTSVKQLYNRRIRGPVFMAHKGGLFLSLPFLALGLAFLIGTPLGYVSVGNSPPPIVAYAFGAMFFISGIVTARQVIGSYAALARSASLKRSGCAPWVCDYAWSQEIVRDESANDFFNSLYLYACAFWLIIPINVLAFTPANASIELYVFTAILDLLGLLVLSFALRAFVRRRKYGVSTLRLACFPFFLGETLDAQLESGHPIGFFKSISITLRCIEEHWEIQQTRDGMEKKVAHKQVYADTLESNQEGVHDGSKPGIPISFPIPEGDFGTAITGKRPRYWELEIIAKTTGVDYNVRFLVPIYAPKPSESLTHARH